MNGILLLDKPKGWTSFDVVAKVRNMVRAETGQKRPKVGHAGTLDPLATGLLIVLVGKTTKRQNEYMKQDKIYQVTLRLGKNSVTGDDEGEKIKISDKQPNLNEVEGVLASFVGEQYQTPPKFSSIKINGQRAYKLARAGKDIDIDPRKIVIYSISNIKYDYPRIEFTCKVSSGTYVRSLVFDIGKKLKTGAYMSDLRRSAIGLAEISSAHSIDDKHLLDFLIT